MLDVWLFFHIPSPTSSSAIKDYFRFYAPSAQFYYRMISFASYRQLPISCTVSSDKELIRSSTEYHLFCLCLRYLLPSARFLTNVYLVIDNGNQVNRPSAVLIVSLLFENFYAFSYTFEGDSCMKVSTADVDMLENKIIYHLFKIGDQFNNESINNRILS